jgi:hypothetical protein
MTSVETTTKLKPKGKPKRRISLASDVVKGDPASIVGGKTEQPARVHRPLPAKPRVVNMATIRFDVQARMDELRPMVEEYNKLLKAEKLIAKIIKDMK